MSSITNLAMTLLLLVAACGIDTPDPPPTYSELYARYFAPGTAGHCANDGCHNGPHYILWVCGDDKDTCYAGMASENAGLINTVAPKLSLIANPANSPLSWINPNGEMPFDSRGPFPEGRDAILAWIAAGAPND